MAWLEQRGGQFHLGIRIGDRKLKRSLQTCDAKEAQETAARVERRLRLIEQGDIVVPKDADLMIFLITDGKLAEPVKIATKLRLDDLFRNYVESIPSASLEANTIYTLKIHLAHIRRLLGDEFPIEGLGYEHLQEYVDKRSVEAGRHGKTVSAVTIRKELTSFSGVWSWGLRMKLVRGIFPNRGLRFAKTQEKPPFQTWEEIERQIEFGGLTEAEEAELWEGLYLTISEIDQVLDYVQKDAPYPVLYPMLVMAAHTGARRSEILRSEIADFDFNARTVRLRELKRAKGKRTMRSVPMSSRLHATMQNWLTASRGRFAFTIDKEPLKVDAASDYFDTTLKGSRWENIRGWHVFRHSFISNCASRGVDQRMIDTWSGHQTEEMRKRYRHLFPTVQREALQSVFGG